MAVDELWDCAIAGSRYKKAEEWVEMIGRGRANAAPKDDDPPFAG